MTPHYSRLRALHDLRLLRRGLYAQVDDVLSSRGVDAVVAYGQSTYLLGAILGLCRRRRIPCLFELNEWQPPARFSGHIVSPIFWDRQVFRLATLRHGAGGVAISTIWERYAANLGVPVIRIPTLGEARILHRAPPVRDRVFTVAYVGNFNDRDLPMTLLEGFRLAITKHVSARLVLIGDAETEAGGRRLMAAVRNDPLLGTLVEFAGRIPDTELPQRLVQADALVLLRPDTWESRAAFPMRIPEYLITGNPCILSAVGDIPLYFQHKDNAMLVPPDRQRDGLAEAIVFLSHSPERAREIGAAGQLTCLHEFSYERHGPRLLRFVNGIRA